MKTLKHHLFRSALCGMIASPAFALEPPPDDAPPPPAPAGEAAEPAPENPAPPVEMPQVAQVTAYLGVGSDGVPEILSTHLGLKAGEGVVVRALDPEGPAAKAGIAESDVITRIGGKEVDSHETLTGIILDHKPGDEIEVDLIHQGKVEKKTVVLGERENNPAVAPEQEDAGIAGMEGLNLENLPEEQANRIRDLIEKNLRGMQGPRGLIPDGEAGALPEIDRAMREVEKRMAEMLQQAQGIQPQGGAPGGAQRLQFMIPGDAPGGVEIQQNATFRFMDEKGSVEMKTTDDGKEVTLRDKHDEITWSGPWDTEQDKAAAPAEARERIGRFNFGNEPGVNGMRFNFRMGGGGIEIQPPVEQENAPEEAEEAPKEAPAEEEKETVE